MDPLDLNEFCNTKNIYEDVCRICLQKNVILNWNYEIAEYFGLTYKECYYKYTQLEILVKDPYSEMLCQACAVDLKKSHFLIKKALESHAVLERTHLTNLQIICIEKEDKINKQVKESNVLSEENKDSGIETLKISFEDKKIPINSNKPRWKDKDIFYENIPSNTILLPPSTLEQISNESIITDNTDDKVFHITSPNNNNIGKTIKKLQVKVNNKVSQKGNETDLVETSTPKEETRKKYMCSNCSKFCGNKKKLKMHEETHKSNRERSEICSVCNIKCFNKQQLRLHLQTHNELREKKYKCEFCEKAYFNMGSLNVHRRIHLGQMVPCPICSKEYHRQIDLDRHYIVAHSEAPLNTDVKKKSKYYVYCKDCNKQVRTPTWKAHQATHLNEPLMKCSICHKEFFTRSTVTHHMYKVHNYKTREEYEQFIVYLKPNRLSHLLLEQQDMLKTNTT